MPALSATGRRLCPCCSPKSRESCPTSSRPKLTSVDRDQALRVLGLDRHAQREDISRAYRRLIRKAHPDVGGDNAAAARITEAYAWLQQAPSVGSPSPAPPATNPSDEKLVLLLPPGDVFARLCELGHQLGELSYLDPDAGIMQVTFTALNSVPCQLVATVIPSDHPRESQVEFTLEPLANGQPPPIATVVAQMFGTR
ncbi:MAG: J domain-containing protein [Acidimicrobiaceae bacterium]|nr:J domain-containing protein [Acidimicrobiaceae bacterium]MXW75059.1 J domain-containing protein [Acidimicrobiaceae bacterium]MYA74214.1 J domain-containing protein [Acidimicrobiaceae bacterium]MYC42506.1 J domain-containing protein [Acidimicrobiaceae bacterium]MYD07582.1 J domain-containing protein [Acidimicrobiaceae bacterium]